MDYQGLTTAEATNLLHRYGPNSVEHKRDSILKLLFKQFLNPLITLLVISSVISFFLHNYIDLFIIAAIILLNTTIGFVQEFRATSQFQQLLNYIKSEVRVLRDGESKFVSKEILVPGDIVFLKLGDIIPADSYLLGEENLLVDESAISGESKPISKKINTKESSSFNAGILWSGSTIVSGTATAKVFATGKSSSFGKVVNLAVNAEKVSEYETNLADLSKRFLIISIGALAFIFVSHILLKHQNNLLDILLFTIAISITIIPEALPVVARLTLYKSALALGKRGVIVKRLAAIEDLGNIDLICADKTGTITKNELTVFDYHNHAAEAEFLEMLDLSSRDSHDPIDVATQNFLHSKHHKLPKMPQYAEQPFDPIKKYSGRKFRDFTIVKGTPEHILELTEFKENLPSKHMPVDTNLIARKISFAINRDGKFRFLGSIFLQDEIRPETASLIDKTKSLGIEMKLISGDSIEVCTSVSTTVKLIDSPKQVVLAEKLHFSDSQKLAQEVEKYQVFARCDPEQKYKIIEMLQQNHFVGYIGDGINDTPSLNLANVSLVVKNSSDVAKSSADLILLSRSLKVIIEAIVDGRKCFENIDKFLLQTLTGNLGNFLTIGLISLFVNYLPMLPIQILISNLLSDVASITIATDNVDITELRKPRNHDNAAIMRLGLIYGILSAAFDLIFFALIADLPVYIIQTSWFAFSTISEIFVLFSLRSKHWLISPKVTKPSPALMASIAFTIVLSTALVYFGADVLSIAKLRDYIIFIIFGLSLIYFFANELLKHIINIFTKPKLSVA